MEARSRLPDGIALRATRLSPPFSSHLCRAATSSSRGVSRSDVHKEKRDPRHAMCYPETRRACEGSC